MEIQVRALEVRAFTQEQIGAVAELHQFIIPPAVARENYRLAAAVDSERQRNVWLGVRTANRADLEFAQPRRTSRLEHHELQLLLDLVEVEMREHRAHQRPGALLELGWTRNRQRLLTARLPHVVEDQKRQAAEMIAMQMTDEQQIEAVGGNPATLERLHQAGSRFHQDSARGRVDQVTRL